MTSPEPTDKGRPPVDDADVPFETESNTELIEPSKQPTPQSVRREQDAADDGDKPAEETPAGDRD
jgi:hypothetical protein